MYSPKIKPELVKRLYRLKLLQAEGKPMTRLVNEAVEEYLNKEEGKKERQKIRPEKKTI